MAFMSSLNSSNFFIGDIPVRGKTILAPMDGYSDSPFRQITRKLGSAASITEFVNTMEVVSRNTKYEERCSFQPSERPIGIQLFDNNPDRIIRGAEIIVNKWNPDWIDINMGCSISHVANRGAGVGLLKDPHLVAEIISGLTGRLSVPITAKIRLGWDNESINFLEIGKILQDNGAAMITLHARTGKQLFSGNPNWDAIALLKQTLQIPVIGNGDINAVSEIKSMLDYTGCDAVMIGRAALQNPWIFAGYNVDEIPLLLFQEICLEHLSLMKSFYGDSRGCILFRKHAKKYLSHTSLEKYLIRDLLTTSDPDLFTEKFTNLIISTDKLI